MKRIHELDSHTGGIGIEGPTTAYFIVDSDEFNEARKVELPLRWSEGANVVALGNAGGFLGFYYNEAEGIVAERRENFPNLALSATLAEVITAVNELFAVVKAVNLMAPDA